MTIRQATAEIVEIRSVERVRRYAWRLLQMPLIIAYRKQLSSLI